MNEMWARACLRLVFLRGFLGGPKRFTRFRAEQICYCRFAPKKGREGCGASWAGIANQFQL